MLLGVLRQNKLYFKKFIAKIFTQLQKLKYIINHTTLRLKIFQSEPVFLQVILKSSCKVKI